MAGNPSDKFTAAQRIYGLGGTSRTAPGNDFYNTPKSQFSYVVHFELTDAAKVLMNTLYHSTTPISIRAANNILRVDKPSTTMTTETFNQYNRSRIVQGKLQYEPISMQLYDTVDSATVMLLDCYKRFYYGDFANKSIRSWRYSTVSTPKNFSSGVLRPDNVFDNITGMNDTWGRSVHDQGDGNGSYFFKRIDIYEIDRGKYTVYNIHNPVIETISMGSKDYSTSDADLITLTWRYEGVSNICPITGNRAFCNPIKSLAFELVGSDGEFSKSAFFKYWGNIDKDSSSISDLFKNGSDTPGFLGAIGGAFVSSVLPGVTGAVLSNAERAITDGNLLDSVGSMASKGFNAVKNIGGLF